MENDIIYFSDFPNLQETGTRKDNGKFDLTLLPTQELKEEFRGYIMYRCKNGTFRALIQDRTAYNHIAKFLNSRINRRIKTTPVQEYCVPSRSWIFIKSPVNPS